MAEGGGKQREIDCLSVDKKKKENRNENSAQAVYDWSPVKYIYDRIRYRFNNSQGTAVLVILDLPL